MSDLGCKFLHALLQYMGGYCFLSCLKMQYHVRIATKFCGCTSCRSRCNCIRLMAMRSSLVALKFFWGPKLLPQDITRPAMISSEPKFRLLSWALTLSGCPLARMAEATRPTSSLPTCPCPVARLANRVSVLRRFLFVLISTRSSDSGGKLQVIRRRSRRGGAAAGGKGAGSAGDMHKFHLSLSRLLFALRGINLGNFLFSNCTILVVFHF